MFKKLLSITLVVLLANVFPVSRIYAETRDEKETNHLVSVKERVNKLGSGENARVELRLRDGRKLKGFIRGTSEENFVVVDAKSGEAVTVAYPQVRQMKGHNLSTGAWVGIGVGAAIMTLLVVWLIVASSD